MVVVLPAPLGPRAPKDNFLDVEGDAARTASKRLQNVLTQILARGGTRQSTGPERGVTR